MNKNVRALIIILFECDKKSMADAIYIDEFINKYFRILSSNKDIIIHHIYSGSKYSLFSKAVLNKIEDLIEKFRYREDLTKPQIFKVVVADTDDKDVDTNHCNEYNQINEKALKYKFEVVWNVKDIEEVFLGQTLSDNFKTREAIKFKKNKNN